MPIPNFLFSATSFGRNHSELGIFRKDDSDVYSKMDSYSSLESFHLYVNKTAFYKNNAHMVYLFVLHNLARKCTKIYNMCRTIVQLIKPFVLDVFATVVVCIKSQP